MKISTCLSISGRLFLSVLKAKSDINERCEHCNMISTTTRQIVLDTETTGMNKLGCTTKGTASSKSVRWR